MGLPNIEITFQALANTAVQRLARGTVGIILKDSKDNGACELSRASQIAEKLPQLGADNRAYIARAFLGYVDAPKKVVAYVLPDSAEDYSEALAYMATQRVDYLAGPPDIDTAGCGEIKDWVLGMREAGATPKAVLPNTAADNCAIVNFTTEGILSGGKAYTAAGYCSRIAGLIAGTPITMSGTSAALPEVEGVDSLSKADMDAAVDAGKFIIYGDGTKVKVARAVNSLTAPSPAKGENGSFKKIKVVEAMDMISDDIRATAQDTYIGRYPNSYENKCLLVVEISNYLKLLERDGVLASGKSSVSIDIAAQEKYLTEQGVDISALSEQDIKEANTGSAVFLAAAVSIIDAIEDITLNVSI